MVDVSKSPPGNDSLAVVPLAAKGEGEKAAATEPMSQEQHFRTDHLLGNLKGRAISGGLVTAGAQVGRFILNFASTMILARLLTPVDFGLVAMVTTLTGFLSMFKDAGLSTATVQKSDITHAQVSNLFWANVTLTGLLSLIVAALAPVLAWFYRDPRLVGITVALSITFLLSGLVVQNQALLNRQMRFKSIACIDISSMAIGLLVGVMLARAGWGYWSLVGQQLTAAITEVCQTWWLSPWRPQLPARRSGTRSMLSFGGSLTAATFLRRLAARGDTLLLGRFYGAESVGLYSRGAVLLMRPVEQFLAPFYAVFVPLLSRLQDQPERYRRTFLNIFNGMALFSFPFAGLCLGLSHPLVLIVLGARWEKVTPVFAACTFAALYYPLVAPANWMLTTQGRGKDFLVLGGIVSLVTVCAFLIGLPFGPAGVALASSGSALLISLPITYYVVGRHGPVSTTNLWAVFLKYLPTWAAAFGGSYLTGRMALPFSPFVQLCISAPVGLLAGAAVVFGMPSQRREAFRLVDAMKRFMTKTQ